MNFEPGDPVIVRDHTAAIWRYNIFSHITENNRFQCVFDEWNICLPFNKETKHLVGTKDDLKEKVETLEEVKGLNFGDKVQVSDDGLFWTKAIFQSYSDSEVYKYKALSEEGLSIYKQCRKANW